MWRPAAAQRLSNAFELEVHPLNFQMVQKVERFFVGQHKQRDGNKQLVLFVGDSR